MAGENQSIGGDNEIEYIPFYGELKMTEATKKPKKQKVVTETTLNEAVGELVKDPQADKLNAIVEGLKQLNEDFKESFETISEKFEDVPEPGTTDVATSPNEADVTRRGFTTMLMARAAKNNMKNPEEYLIVELRDVQGAILAYYVTHKREEL